jgi:hypothetical protein
MPDPYFPFVVMMFEDLTPYVYYYEGEQPRPLNVGWPDRSLPFAKGETTDDFKERLFALCENPVKGLRGFHCCMFCVEESGILKECEGLEENARWDRLEDGGDLDQVTEQREGRVFYLGAAEIRVTAKDANVYAAPNLILHYVLKHRYKPPEEFIRAVCEHQ